MTTKVNMKNKYILCSYRLPLLKLILFEVCPTLKVDTFAYQVLNIVSPRPRTLSTFVRYQIGFLLKLLYYILYLITKFDNFLNYLRKLAYLYFLHG